MTVKSYREKHDKFALGLVGYPLGYSDSPAIFRSIFEKTGVQYLVSYSEWPIRDLMQMDTWKLRANGKLGFNVTTPYKKDILSLCEKFDPSVVRTGAANTVVMEEGIWTAYNTDLDGFKRALIDWDVKGVEKALVLGTGGAAEAVKAALEDLDIASHFVSRSPTPINLGYDRLDHQNMHNCRLIVNATPLGKPPFLNYKPQLPYHLLSSEHILIDLNYTPEKSLFLKEGEMRGCRIINGKRMLFEQANLAWNVWCEHFPFLKQFSV